MKDIMKHNERSNMEHSSESTKTASESCARTDKACPGIGKAKLVLCKTEREINKLMSAIIFDTLKFTKRLMEAGASPELAEATAEAFKDASGEANLVTKTDLDGLEYRLIIKMGAMFITNILVLSVLYKLFG